MINRFLIDNHFSRCTSTDSLPYTFVNESRNYFSNIDYMVYNNAVVNDFTVIEPHINFSDHLPSSVLCKVNFCLSYLETDNRRPDDSVEYLRWDHADLLLYHSYTRDYFTASVRRTTCHRGVRLC